MVNLSSKVVSVSGSIIKLFIFIGKGEKNFFRKGCIMRRGLMLYSLISFLALGSFAHANLLVNGDFELPGDGTPATGWVAWFWGGGWANTEIAAWGSPGGTYHIAVGAAGNGGGGYYQLIPVTAGEPYSLTVDSGADAWWLPTGTMAMIWLRNDTLDPLDPENIIIEDIRNTVDPAVYGDNYDIPHPWESYSLAGTAPAGATMVKVELAANNATGSIGFDNASLTLTNNPYPPHDPLPSYNETGVAVDTTLSWAVSDPGGVVDPSLASHKLYMSNGTDPNLYFIANVPEGWAGDPARESYTLASNLDLDGRYFWRVDMVKDDTSEVTGPTWVFYTPVSAPVIVADPDYQLVDASIAANFSVTVSSVSPETYQWYKSGDPDVSLSDGGDISGATTNSLTIANSEVADEGAYYCVVNNESAIPVASAEALLIVKRKIAHWDFESANANSTVAGSPASIIIGDPVFVTGISGDGMEFDADTGAEDMLYTDPNDANTTGYFESSNFNLTAACWIKSTSTVNWAPLVARNGEENGWQLRQGAAGLEGDDRPIFSTRGLAVGDNDGVPGDRTVFDGQWHYVVGTYDGAFKKLYIDGVLSLVYTLLDGGGGVEISSNGEAATGLIGASALGSEIPVAIAGRYGDDPAGIDEQFTAGTYDEVEIYNYALDAATIAQNYATITGTPVCPAPLDYDQNGDCKVNLDDFAPFASAWLTDTSVQP